MRSRAVGYMALSALGFSAMSVLVKLAARELPTGEIVLARAAVKLGLSFALVRRARPVAMGQSPPQSVAGGPVRSRSCRSRARRARDLVAVTASRAVRARRHPESRAKCTCEPTRIHEATLKRDLEHALLRRS
jgi:hypothetical protein